MRREAIKAFVGFFFLGIILGGFYLLLRSVVGPERDDSDAARHAYMIDRSRAVEPDPVDLSSDGGEEVVPDANPPCPAVTVRGRVLDQRFEPLAEAAAAAADGNEPTRLAADGAWLTAASFKDVRMVTLSLPGRQASLGPFPVGASEGTVRFNWIVPDPSTEKLAFKDLASVTVGKQLRVLVSGSADLPEGTRLFASLSRGDRRWTGEECVVAGKRFRGTLSPTEEGFPSGVYTVKLEFNPLVQSEEGEDALIPEDAGETPEAEGSPPEPEVTPDDPLPDDPLSEEQFPEEPLPEEPPPTPTKWDGLPTMEIAISIYVGDPATEESERGVERKDFRTVYVRGKALRRTFMALRDLGLASKGWSWGHRRGAERYFTKGVPLVERNGQFDAGTWRFWIDEQFLPQLDALDAIVARHETGEAVETAMLLDSYAKALRKFVHLVSWRVYDGAGFEPDARDTEAIAVSMALDDEEDFTYQKLRGLEVKLAAVLGEKEKGDGGAGEAAPFK